MAYKSIEVEKKEGVTVVTMNRPHVLNALNFDLVTELQGILDVVSTDEETRVVVLQGAGGNFCSGADMSLFMENLSAPEWLTGMKGFGHLISTLREIPQPVISKVRGVAVGGGINLALAGDFVVASHDARFREIFVHIGAVLDGGGTYFLPRLVGMARARELALLGDFFDGRTAASMGLIYKSVPDEDLDGEVDALAGSLSKRSPRALALIKEGLEGSLDMSLNKVLEWEGAHQSVMLQSPEHKELVRMFLDSRGKEKEKGG